MRLDGPGPAPTAGPTKAGYDQGRKELERAGGDKVEELGWKRVIGLGRSALRVAQLRACLRGTRCQRAGGTGLTGRGALAKLDEVSGLRAAPGPIGRARWWNGVVCKGLLE